ncbi:MAG TPA: hypothetical protein VMZ28_07240 [Kofleriaceae bacterium]|nr:hypothetical protein [Kofleriaceae bacterium]
MGRSHGPREPRRRMPVWQPEPLHIPVDEPPRRHIRQPDDTDDADGDEDDRPGTHVIVIDLA